MNEIYTETFEQDWSSASIYTDDANRIIGMNINDLTGNTGWQLMPPNETGKTEQELFDNLTESHGVPLYKVEGGAMVCRTAEEIAADIPPEPAPAPSREDELQAQIDALTIALLEG